MVGGEYWLLRPVGHGMCKFEGYLDGSIGLNEIAMMNEWLDVRITNENILHDHYARR